MPKYSQANRPIAVTTPLGADVLLLQQFSGSEAISKLFRFRLELLAESSTDVAFDQLLGQSVTVNLNLPDGSTRHLNGIVSRFAQGSRTPSPMGEAFFTRYRAEIVPKLWLLTRNAQSRIFQQIAVPDILKQVLTGLDGRLSAPGHLRAPRLLRPVPRDRLRLRQPAHGGRGHLSTSSPTPTAVTRWSWPTRPRATPDVPGPTTVIYEELEGGPRQEDRVTAWEKSQEIRSGKYHALGPLLRAAGQNFEAVKPSSGTVAAGTVTHKLKLGRNENLELYDFPGGYAQRFDGVDPGGGDRAADLQKIFQDNARTVGIRMQQEAAAALLDLRAGQLPPVRRRVQVHPRPALQRQRRTS